MEQCVVLLVTVLLVAIWGDVVFNVMVAIETNVKCSEPVISLILEIFKISWTTVDYVLSLNYCLVKRTILLLVAMDYVPYKLAVSMLRFIPKLNAINGVDNGIH